MEESPESRELMHDLESKTASLSSAAKLLKGKTPQQKQAMIALMIESAKDIQHYLEDLKKGI
jgi:hypothetical protein